MDSFNFRPGGYRPWSTQPPRHGELPSTTKTPLKLIAFTGAGISVASGIPTFAEQPGIRDQLSRAYADECPLEFNKLVADWQTRCSAAEPNDAHLVLAEHHVPVVTMNVDGLHGRAGSTDLIEVHGRLPNVVLYGDAAPEYQTALKFIDSLGYRGFVLLVVGVSGSTAFAEKFVKRARQRAFAVIDVNADAEVVVRRQVERLRGGLCRLE